MELHIQLRYRLTDAPTRKARPAVMVFGFKNSAKKYCRRFYLNSLDINVR